MLWVLETTVCDPDGTLVLGCFVPKIPSLSAGDYTGGDLHWALGASLVTPIFRKPDWPLKGHFFCNAGKLAGFGSGELLSSADPCCWTDTDEQAQQLTRYKPHSETYWLSPR